jgi:cell division protein FtsZ
VIDDALGDEVRVTVIAAGFDGGAPAYKPADSSRKSAGPLETAGVGAALRQPGAPPPRRVLFDDVDVPDFLKNGA